MTRIAKSVLWASLLVALAVANRLGLIADASATTLFSVIPAVWITTRRPRSCQWKGPAT